MWLKTKKTYIWIFWHIWKHLCLNRTVNTRICNVCSSLFPEVTSEYKVIGLSNCMLLSLRLTMHTSINTHTHKWHIQTHILSQLVSFSRRATGVITDCKLWFPVWRTSRCFCKLAQDEYLPKTHSTSKTFFFFFFSFFGKMFTPRMDLDLWQRIVQTVSVKILVITIVFLYISSCLFFLNTRKRTAKDKAGQINGCQWRKIEN